MINVDIWSDVRCPFCYIGKHKFEQALEKFEHKKEVAVTWHSFELDPGLETKPEMSTIDYFVETKGVSEEQAKQMLAGAKNMGNQTGLTMDLENTVLANSFKAHQLIQLARSKGMANEMEEALFKANFAEVQNIDDEEVLVSVGTDIGLSEKECRDALSSKEFAEAVRQDEKQAQQIGIQGVPFFVFNNKYGVSGAQSPETFLDVLQKVQKENTPS